jgi:hypothetical protein
MKTMSIVLTCAVLLAACGTQSSNTGANSNVGGSPNVGAGPIGTTSSSSILMERIKQQDSGGR